MNVNYTQRDIVSDGCYDLPPPLTQLYHAHDSKPLDMIEKDSKSIVVEISLIKCFATSMTTLYLNKTKQ